MAQIKQCTKRGDEHTEGRDRARGTEREGGRLVGPYTQSLPSCMTLSDWLVCGVSSGGGWEAR